MTPIAKVYLIELHFIPNIQMLDYESVDEQRLKINQQRVAEIFFLFTFLELNERCQLPNFDKILLA